MPPINIDQALYKPARIALTQNFWTAVAIQAALRVAANDGRRAKDSDMGDEKNLEIDIQGVAGELAALRRVEFLVEGKGLKYDAECDGPVNDVDIRLDTSRIEVKCVLFEPWKKKFLINGRGHEHSKQRKAIGYMPVISILGGTHAYVGSIIPLADVDAWEERDFNNKNRPALQIDLETLCPKYFRQPWADIREALTTKVKRFTCDPKAAAAIREGKRPAAYAGNVREFVNSLCCI